jgi:hypothetical protein
LLFVQANARAMVGDVAHGAGSDTGFSGIKYQSASIDDGSRSRATLEDVFVC